VRRAEADGRLAGDHRRAIGFQRHVDRGGDLIGILPVDMRGIPAGGLEALDLIDRVGERQRPSIEMPLSSKRKMSFDSLRWPARAIASWLTPSIRSPSEQMTKVRWSTMSSPNSAASMRSASAKPTRRRRPGRAAGGRLDAGRDEASGWPAFSNEAAGSASIRRGSSPRSRSDRGGRRGAPSRGRPTARNGRGRATADRRDRISGSARTAPCDVGHAIGMPGWPDLAFSTPSMARARIAFAIRLCWARSSWRLFDPVPASVALIDWRSLPARADGGPAVPADRSGRGGRHIAVGLRCQSAVAPRPSRLTIDALFGYC